MKFYSIPQSFFIGNIFFTSWSKFYKQMFCYLKGTLSPFQSFWDSKARIFLSGSEMKFSNQVTWEVNQYSKLRLVDVQWWPAASWIQLNYRCISRGKRCYGNSRSRLQPCKVKFKVARQSLSLHPLKPAYSRSVPLQSAVNRSPLQNRRFSESVWKI